MGISLSTPAIADGATGWGNALRSDLTNIGASLDSLAAGQAAGSGLPGIVQLDSFSGSTDDAKLTNALSYAAAQTLIPAVMLPSRLVQFSQSRTVFGGMKIVAAPVNGWPMAGNSSGKLNTARVRLNVGTGNNAWLVGASTTFGGYIANINFEAANGNCQFMDYPLASGTAYCWAFHSLGFDGFKHVFGQPSSSCAITAWTLSGSWSMTSCLDTQCTLGGSDSDLWTDGSCNIGPNGSGANTGTGTPGNGKYLMMFSSLGKSNVGGVFYTCDTGWRAFSVTGSDNYGAGLYMRGMRIEGRNANDPSAGSLVRVKSGHVSISQSSLSYAMADPNAYPDGPDKGVVYQTGGYCYLDDVTYDRTAGVAESVPLLYTSAGEAIITRVKRGAKGGGWSGRPVAQQASSGLIIVTDPTTTLVTSA